MPVRPTDSSFWKASPTVKEKNAANRSVTALLDALAPERIVRRAEQPRMRIERFRTPDGAVLQGATAAMTVSWFPESVEGSALGELHVRVWRGTVTRRGALHPRERAVVRNALIVRPLEPPAGDRVWISADGTTYDTETLADHCLRLLETEIAESSG
jgi:hypothetical protein